MSTPPPANTDDANDAVDLAALGKAYTPPQDLDTSPEVSDVIATLPWWAARGLLYIIIGFVAGALIWAWLSKIDVVIEARGTLVPEGNVRPVQATGGGPVLSVLVKEGDTVTGGQPLVQMDGAELRLRLAKLQEELSDDQQQLRQLLATGTPAEKLEQQTRIARVQSEITSVEESLRHTTITAPFGGTITTLGVRFPGTVLEAGQTVATIAPTNVPLVVEAQVPNKDIAFVERGLPVKLKFDAFPFQDYGTVEGTVTEVAPDAQTDKEAGSFYQITIAPQQTNISAKGKDVPLRPGLALTAEIITERKSVLSLLFEPFRKLKGEAGGT
jgi:multidrug efflux pump subunit AcrA (membrane-fusion protein)